MGVDRTPHSRLQVLLQSGQLKMAQDLPDGPLLIRELQNFRYSISQSANDIYGARQGEHDDLVLATALTTWMAYRGAGRGA
jgi:hypothetical protein